MPTNAPSQPINATGRHTGKATSAARLTVGSSRNDRWFATTLNPAFPSATAFLGDYSNIAVVPGHHQRGGVLDRHAPTACFPSTICGHGEDAYFARAG